MYCKRLQPTTFIGVGAQTHLFGFYLSNNPYRKFHSALENNTNSVLKICFYVQAVFIDGIRANKVKVV